MSMSEQYLAKISVQSPNLIQRKWKWKVEIGGNVVGSERQAFALRVQI